MSRRNLNIVIEKLSYIHIQKHDNGFVLEDVLFDKRFEINEVAYDICCVIDGNKSLKDIAAHIAQIYGIDLPQAEADIWEVFRFLKRNKLIIIKNSLTYYYIRGYYSLIFFTQKT